MLSFSFLTFLPYYSFLKQKFLPEPPLLACASGFPPSDLNSNIVSLYIQVTIFETAYIFCVLKSKKREKQAL